MQSDYMLNVIIVGVVGAVLFFIIIIAMMTKRATTKKAAENAPKDARLFESRAEIPKLPRNQTIYQILKNSSLAVNKIGFDPNYVFEEVASLIREDLRSSNVELLFDIEADIPEQLIGSPKRLERVLINFIENAVQYSNNGVVKMQVSVAKNNGVDCTLRFIIQDEGRGMDTAQIGTLLIDPLKREVAGLTPYGIYVANALIRAEKGTLDIQSALGRGTTVTFDMVFKVPQTHKAPVQRRPSDECGALKIAVVVRHAETARVLKKHLEPFVAEVMTMITETPLLNTKTLENYDMVIIDHQLGDRDLWHGLKSRGIWLVTLQNIIEPDTAEGLAAADYQLSLPFTHAHLVEMLTVFYGEGNGKPAEAAAAVPEAEFDTFVSDEQIPVTRHVSKKDFDRFIGAKLLIVEDNPINQRVIKGLLGDSGIHLFFAENGLEALEVLSEEAPLDLVLMDINMPILDGIETTRRIRREHHFDNIPIVAFTGLNLKEQIEKMKEAGMNAHMAKPLNIGRLYSVFMHFLPKSPQVAEG